MTTYQQDAALISASTLLCRCSGAASNVMMGLYSAKYGANVRPKIHIIMQCCVALFHAFGMRLTQTLFGRCSEIASHSHFFSIESETKITWAEASE